jgi:hypothetical protein
VRLTEPVPAGIQSKHIPVAAQARPAQPVRWPLNAPQSSRDSCNPFLALFYRLFWVSSGWRQLFSRLKTYFKIKIICKILQEYAKKNTFFDFQDIVEYSL